MGTDDVLDLNKTHIVRFAYPSNSDYHECKIVTNSEYTGIAN